MQFAGFNAVLYMLSDIPTHLHTHTVIVQQREIETRHRELKGKHWLPWIQRAMFCVLETLFCCLLVFSTGPSLNPLITHALMSSSSGNCGISQSTRSNN